MWFMALWINSLHIDVFHQSPVHIPFLTFIHGNLTKMEILKSLGEITVWLNVLFDNRQFIKVCLRFIFASVARFNCFIVFIGLILSLFTTIKCQETTNVSVGI